MPFTLERPGARLAVDDRPAAGTPVILTHGAGMDRTSFDSVADVLATAGHRVLAWDLRGHGESALAERGRFTAGDALDDLEALVDSLGEHRPVLVGHSLGGNLSQALVRRRPSAVRGLVVIGSTPNSGPLTVLERLAVQVLSRPALALVPAKRLPSLMASASAVQPDAVARITAVFERMPKSRFLDVWAATASLVSPDPDYRTPVPLALIRGSADQTGNIATAMPAWAAREGVADRVVQDAGHVAMLDRPEETAAAVLDAVSAMR